MDYNLENEEVKREDLIIDDTLRFFFEINSDKPFVLSNRDIWDKIGSWFSGKWYQVIQISGNDGSILWGLKSGIYIDSYNKIHCLLDKKDYRSLTIPNTIKKLENTISIKNTKTITFNTNPFGDVYDMELSEPEVQFFKEWFEKFEEKVDKEFQNKIEHFKKEKLKETERLKDLKISQTNVLSELDKDGNGEVDVVEGNDFNTLLKKHQKSIVEIDRNYVQQFVKISSYLKTKKGNIQSIFNSIKDTPNQEVLNEYVEILKDEIHTYNLVLFNSLNMIVSLVEDDMIPFYEIHEMFDTLNMFDSKHEKDVSQKLTNIGDGLESLMYEIRDMGNQISNSIDELSYITEESNKQLENQLSEIDSTLKVGNLISTINTYQTYKINKNTKSLRG